MCRRFLQPFAPLILTFFALAGLRAAAQEQAGDPPLERIDALVEEVRAAHGVPALAGAFVADGRLRRVGVAGARRRGGDVAAALEDRWHLGSCTKAMTATLCARLVEKGVLGWDATVGAVLPERAAKMDPRFRDATLATLLTMTAGVPSDLRPDGLWAALWRREGTPPEQRLRLLDGILDRTPVHEPGTFEYANASFAVAGILAERAAGASYEDLMRREVFGPLGMSSAGFGPPPAIDEGGPLVGHAGEDGATPVPPGDAADNPPAIAPAGTVHATIADWAKFVAAHLEGRRGKSPLLETATFERLHTPPAGRNYAMGWVVAERPWGGRVLTHNGSNTMWFAVAWLAPEKGFAALAITNQAGKAAPDATDALVGRLIQEATRAAPAAKPAESLPAARRALRGRVRYAGPRPTPDERPVDDALRAVCGHETHGDRRLQVGEDGGLANALLALRPGSSGDAAPPRAPAPPAAVLEKRGCAISPRILVVPPGTTVTFRNVDSPCNGFGLSSRKNGAATLLVGAGEEATLAFAHPEIVAIRCPVRPRDMAAFVAVLETPHAAVTAADGRFEIRDLPEGSWSLDLWHERTGWRRDVLDAAALARALSQGAPLAIEVPESWLRSD